MATLLMRQWLNQSSQQSLKPVPFHSANPHKRDFHGGVPHIYHVGAPIRHWQLLDALTNLWDAPERTGEVAPARSLVRGRVVIEVYAGGGGVERQRCGRSNGG